MARTESKRKQVQRLTRSNNRDPMWETLYSLQERVKYLERQLRRSEKTQAELEEEIQDLEAEIARLPRTATRERVRELELRNLNLSHEVARLRGILRRQNIPAPPPLNRTFSSFQLP